MALFPLTILWWFETEIHRLVARGKVIGNHRFGILFEETLISSAVGLRMLEFFSAMGVSVGIDNAGVYQETISNTNIKFSLYGTLRRKHAREMKSSDRRTWKEVVDGRAWSVGICQGICAKQTMESGSVCFVPTMAIIWSEREEWTANLESVFVASSRFTANGWLSMRIRWTRRRIRECWAFKILVLL